MAKAGLAHLVAISGLHVGLVIGLLLLVTSWLLGRVQGLPVIDDAVLDPDADYRIRTRAMLNMQQYPAALRILFFWRGEWQLESEWFEWLLER